MRIFLVDPPMQSIMRARADWYPMSLAYLAGAAKREGHEVLIYNGEHDAALNYVNLVTYSQNYHYYLEALQDPAHPAWRKVADVMARFKPDVVGITSFSVKWPSAQRIAKIAKDYNRNIPVIMGGQHATILTEDVLAEPHIDFVAKGEGEETFVEFLRELKNGQRWETIDGLSFKNAKGIIHNPPRPLRTDLDGLAMPARECLFDLENYEPHALAKLFASRGCPFRCNYCGTQNIWTNALRVHGPQRIIDEILQVKKEYGATTFTFFDDVFGTNRKYTLGLLDGMIRAKPGITWDCLTRANLVNDELLDKMKEAGCTKIDMGVESGSDKILKDTEKGVTVKQLEEGSALIKKHGIFLYVFLMIGLPTETEEDAQKTREFLLRVKPDWAGISIFTPIPGTGQYKKLQEEGKIPPHPDFAKFSHQSPNNNFAFSMNNRGDFPKLAREMIQFVEDYNGRWIHILRRAMTRGYFKNPKLLWLDLKKVATWKGILKASHQGSHMKFYDKGGK